MAEKNPGLTRSAFGVGSLSFRSWPGTSMELRLLSPVSSGVSETPAERTPGSDFTVAIRRSNSGTARAAS